MTPDLITKPLRKLHLALLAIIAMAGALWSCTDDLPDDRFIFIGDSLITRWDLQEGFPMLMTSNYGKSGSGIKHLEQNAGIAKGKIAVVLSGTNDLYTLTSDEAVEQYAANFIQAVSDLNARHAFVISVLPRGLETGEAVALIRKLNGAVEQLVSAHPDGRITFVDAYPLLATAEGSINPQYSYDGLHLSSYGYEILNKTLIKYFSNKTL